MKKLLLGTAAVALGMSFVAAQAQAQVKLDVAGHTKLYGTWIDQDTAADDLDTVANEAQDERSVDILRETELHFTGETTLDNGLTVGFHNEVDVDGTDGGADGLFNEESYAYFSGAWGRVNFGKEDGAAYLLQVAAPSADSNFDGIRQWVDPVFNNILTAPATSGASTIDNMSIDDIFTSFTANTVVVDADASDTSNANDILVGANGAGNFIGSRFDYDQAVSGFNNKLTYMTPVFNGFQAGVSYTPEITGTSQDLNVNDDDSVFDGTEEYGDVFDVAARWEGMLGEVGMAIGAGYTHAELEADDGVAYFYQDVNGDAAFTAGTDLITATLDDREAWNVGVDFDWKAFGLGGGYTEDDNGVSGDALESETWFVGLDYTTGPFKLGATYFTQDQAVAGAELETDRWTGGVVYTYGPGMTFRGSVSYIDFEEDAGFATGDADATSVLLGTQIDF